MTVNTKYKLVDSWMRWKRAQEEVVIVKNEMMNYLKYLFDKRSSLQEQVKGEIEEMKCYLKNVLDDSLNQQMEEDGRNQSNFSLGKRAILRSEIRRLTFKIQEAMTEWKFLSNQDLHSFFLQPEAVLDADVEMESSFDSKSEILSDYNSEEDSEFSDSDEEIPLVDDEVLFELQQEQEINIESSVTSNDGTETE